jgi:hypothetical protein
LGVRPPNDPPIVRAFSWLLPLCILKVLVKPADRTIVAAVGYLVTRNLAIDECNRVVDQRIDDSGIGREHLLQRLDVVEIKEVNERIMAAVA